LNIDAKFAYENKLFLHLHKLVLLTDSGYGGVEQSFIKSLFVNECPNYQLIELSHSLQSYDIVDAYFYLKMVHNSFPALTVFLILVGDTTSNVADFVAVSMDEKIFIAPNNGLLPLFLNNNQPNCYSLSTNVSLKDLFNKINFLNPSLEPNWPLLPNPEYKIIERTQYVDDAIIAPIIGIDNFGSCYLEIDKKDFFDFMGTQKYTIRLRRDEVIYKILPDRKHISPGDTGAYFHENKSFLVITMMQSNLAKLFGLIRGKKIIITKI